MVDDRSFSRFIKCPFLDKDDVPGFQKGNYFYTLQTILAFMIPFKQTTLMFKSKTQLNNLSLRNAQKRANC